MANAKTATARTSIPKNRYGSDTPAIRAGETLEIVRRFSFGGEPWSKVRTSRGKLGCLPDADLEFAAAETAIAWTTDDLSIERARAILGAEWVARFEAMEPAVAAVACESRALGAWTANDRESHAAYKSLARIFGGAS